MYPLSFLPLQRAFEISTGDILFTSNHLPSVTRLAAWRNIIFSDTQTNHQKQAVLAGVAHNRLLSYNANVLDVGPTLVP